MDLDTYLADCDARYSAELHRLGVTWSGPRYHTRVLNGSLAHPMHESLDDALALLQSGAPQCPERAAAIISAALGGERLPW